MTPYRTAPETHSTPTRWWHRIKCRFGAHEFIGPPRAWTLGEYMPCAHCAANLTRIVSPVDGREFFAVTEARIA